MEITSRDSQRRGESPEPSVNSRHLHKTSTSIITLVEVI